MACCLMHTHAMLPQTQPRACTPHARPTPRAPPATQHPQREANEAAYECKRNAKMLEASEQALQWEKEEVSRLYAGMQVCARTW